MSYDERSDMNSEFWIWIPTNNTVPCDMKFRLGVDSAGFREYTL